MKVVSLVRFGACALAVWGCSTSKHPDAAAEPDGGVVAANDQPDGGVVAANDRPDAGSTPVATAPTPDAGTPDAGPTPPLRIGRWTYFGKAQGLSNDVRDVSPDEGGNVYVAGGDALYAKQRSDDQFLRFDWQNAGLSKKCNDPAQMNVDLPTTPFFQCPVNSVGGAAPGKAVVGFDGFGREGDGGSPWALETGGADLVAFDPAKGTLTRTRHVLTAAPPHVICDNGHTEWVTTCVEPPPVPGQPPLVLWFWENGRRLTRRIRRVVVNHDSASRMYGDVWMGGNHGTLQVLLNNAQTRGWVDTVDPAFGFDLKWQEAKDVWEHIHPAVPDPNNPGDIIVGEGYGVSIDPRNGQPWGSNGIRTTTISGYPDLVHRQWGSTTNTLAVWPEFPLGDDIRSISHCPDGSLWVASTSHGLARIVTDNLALPPARFPLPDGTGALTVACDPDGSLWVGRAAGGVLRFRNGQFEAIDPTPAAPAFASHPVLNIQLDTRTTPRITYFAFGASTDAQGLITAAGGVAAYDGP